MAVDQAVHEVLMPRLSDTMTEGIITEWHKSEGDTVANGEPLAEVETDKVTTEIVAPADGTLLRLFVGAGGAMPPGEVVALVGPEGTELPEREIEPQTPPKTADAQPAAPPSPVPAVASENGDSGRVSATPLAKRLAASAGVDVGLLGPGSGRNGRVLRHDVEQAIAASLSAPPTSRDEVVAPTRVELVIARRMTAAKQDVPHYYIDVAADVTRLLALRKDARAQESPLDVPVTAYIMRAVALALRQFSRVNASWTDEMLHFHSSINIGLAVATDDGGLVVPVVENADTKSVSDLAAESAELIARARDGKLTAADMSGGTFTISNLGMTGIESFHAVINPPESGILAVGGVRRVPKFEGDQIVASDVLRMSLSADHRVYSGATAAAFVVDIQSRLERPLGLL